MSRLRNAFVTLVILPALVFTIGGLYIAHRSRAALGPALDRHVAERAVEYSRLERERLTESLRISPERLGMRAAQLDIERFSVYNSAGQVVATFPDATPVPLDLGTEQGDAILAAARRGQTVADLVQLDGRPVWLAYVPGDDRVAVALVRADSSLAVRFSQATGYDLAFYLGTTRALATGEDWPGELPVAVLDSLASLDRAVGTRIAGRAAAAPLKDFDDWDVTGAILVRATESAPPAPAPPFLPMFGLVLGAALMVIAVRRITLHSTLRRGFALALIPPAVAAAWLAAADGQLSARATDALLELSGRVVSAVDDPTAIPADRLARLAGADIAVLEDDSVVAASIELPASTLTGVEEPTGRLRIGGRRIAYRRLTPESDAHLFLLRDPLEDSRKTALFWLAGLYGLLGVGVLIYASFASSAGSRAELHETATAWSFIAPSLVLLLVFSAAPLLFAFYLSFHEWNLLEPAKPFVGLRHYLDLASDGLFWNAAKNTAIYSLYVPATMACALGVAILLNRSIRGVALLRAVFFLPYITSFVAISIVWQWMYDPDFGLFNWALGLIGLGPYPWLNSPATALMALIIMAVWIHIGFQMVIFLAGLQAIPNELYEAATIDGAGPWRRFWKITLPLLRPTTFFVLVTSIIGSFQIFTFVYVMTEGGPLHATDVIVYHIYQNAWRFLRMGYASAMSWALFAVIFAITLLQFRTLGRKMVPS